LDAVAELRRRLPTPDAWTPFGVFAALLLAVLAGFELRGEGSLAWIPLGICALCATYFAVAAGVLVLHGTDRREFDEPFAYYGPVAALAALCLLVVAAWRAWDGSLPEREGLAVRLAGVLLVTGLLASFLLPWEQIGEASSVGIVVPALVVASVLAVWLGAAWWRGGSWQERLGLSAATLLFTLAGLAWVPREARARGAWIGVGLAAALFALASVRSPRPALPRLPAWLRLVPGAAAVLFVGSLFLPWQRSCDPSPGGFGCESGDGWTTPGTGAAVLALALGLALLVPGLLRVSPALLAAGLALLVTTMGLQLDTGWGHSFAYGAWIGFGCAAALVATGLAEARPRLGPRDGPVEAIAPLVCLAYLALLLVPWWDVLSRDLERELRFGEFSGLTVVGILLGLRLFGRWGASARSDELWLLPLGMFALAALDIVQYRWLGLTWGGATVAALCLGLALLGRIRVRGVPEVLRIDRIEVPGP
jgi:hypothetical protein